MCQNMIPSPWNDGCETSRISPIERTDHEPDRFMIGMPQGKIKDEFEAFLRALVIEISIK